MAGRLSSTWLDRRRRLHAAYDRVTGLVDASHLVELLGEPAAWTLEEAAALWRGAPSGPEVVNHAYVHVPFCKSICHFCNYERLRPSHPAELRAWLDDVRATLHAIGPAVAHLAFHTLYIGGGTPSVLPTALLEELLDALDAGLPFVPLANRHFEFDPAVFGEDKLDRLLAHGFRHFSFGIQSLQAEVMAAHNRGPQSRELVGARLAEFHARGVHGVSCDLLMGLAGTHPEQVVHDVRWILERFPPVWIDIFQLTPTASYVERAFGGSREAFFAHLAPFRDAVAEGLEPLARAHGYTLHVGTSHGIKLRRKAVPLWVPPPQRGHLGPPFGYTQQPAQQGAPMNLLGLGPSARSLVFDQAELTCVTGEGAPRFRGVRLRPGEQAAQVLLMRLRDHDEADRSAFRAMFGTTPEEAAPAAWAAWAAEGRLVDGALLPADRRQRHRDLLWLLPDHALEADLARHAGLDLSVEGLATLLWPLGPGSPLSWDLYLVDLEPAHLVLTGGVRIRVTPPLTPDGRPGLAVEGRFAGNVDDLRRALGAVQKALDKGWARRRHPG